MGIIKKITSIFKKKNTSSSSSSSSSSGSSLPQSTIMTPTTGVTGTSSSSSSGGSSGGSDPLTSAYYSNKGSSSGGSSGGSSSSSSSLPQSTLLTPTAGITSDLTKIQTQAEINQAVKSGGLSKAQKLEASKDFSGKVDVFGTTGLLESSKYYVGGSEVGSLKYGETRTGRNTGRDYFTPYEQPVAETKKKSKLTFEKGEDIEEIEFTKEGASISETRREKEEEKKLGMNTILLKESEAKKLGININKEIGGEGESIDFSRDLLYGIPSGDVDKLISGGGISYVKREEKEIEERDKLKNVGKFLSLTNPLTAGIISDIDTIKTIKEEGIYSGVKKAITEPIVISEIPVLRKVPKIVYDIGEGTVKGSIKGGAYLGDLGFEKITGKKAKGGLPEFFEYDKDTPFYADPDVQTATITGATIGLAGAGKVGAEILKQGGRVIAGYSGYQAIKSPTEENIAMALLFTAPELYANRGLVLQEISNKKPSKFIPSKNEILEVSKTSRQRATLMIKDENGNYLVSKKGISAGGNMEVGESSRIAVLRELKEELGLTGKDLENFRFREKIVTPEETFHVYEGTIKDKSKISPSSDMSDGIKWISKKEYNGITGQTFRNPIEKNLFLKGKVRMYELGIMNRLSGNKRPVSWLGYNTKFGKVYFGTQSRYDVAGEIAKEYQKLDEEMLIHGTPNIPLELEFGKGIKVSKQKNVRGGEGLYFQPPVSTKEIPLDVLKLEGYTGKGKKLTTKKIEELPIEVRRKSPEGYVGLSYLDFGTPSSYDLTLNPFANLKRRGVYVLKGKVGKDIKITKKALAGKESEQVVKFERELEPTGRGEYIWVKGKKIRVRETILKEPPIEKVMKEKKGEKLERENKKTIKSEIKNTEYITPYKSLRYKKPIIYDLPKEILNTKEYTGKEVKKESIRKIKEGIKREKYTPKEEIFREIEKGEPYIYTTKEPKEKYPSEPKIPIEEPPRETIFNLRKKDIKKKQSKEIGYNVFIKEPKTKRYVKVTKKPLSLRDTRNLLSYGLDKSVSRQGYIKSSKNKASLSPYDISPTYSQDTQKKFRVYKVRKGQRIPLQERRIIEKSKYMNDSKSEQKQLSIFRVLAKLEKKKMKSNINNKNKHIWESIV